MPEKRNRLLEAALEYARAGWPVFPITSNEKKPPLVAFSVEATTDEATIRKWWKKWPHANVGVRTGVVHFVLDVDPDGGGEESLERLERQHGELVPRSTRQQITPRGGRHYALSLPDFKIHNSESLLGPGLDVRGHHGYHLVAPSVVMLRDQEGKPLLDSLGKPIRKPYFWDGADLNQPLLPGPEWLINWLRADSQRHEQLLSGQGIHEQATRGNGAPGLGSVPEGKIPHGVQHKYLVSVAGTMRRRGLEFPEIFEALKAINLHRCSIPGSEKHIQQYAESVCRYAPHTPLDELLAKVGAEIPLHSSEPEPEPEPEPPLELSEPFPKIAWRGPFDDYRRAMADTTEASDVCHFSSLWGAAGATLGRQLWMFSGELVYPNTYQVFFGPTGDKKTTAQKLALYNGLIPLNIPLHSQLGSTEGLAQFLQKSGQNSKGDSVAIFFWEEVSTFFAHASWKGSALMEFFTECYNCPPTWGKTYKKDNAINIIRPTPSILSGTTVEWFWKNASPGDFHGGFANRATYLAGPKKSSKPNPKPPVASLLGRVQEAFQRMSKLPPMQVRFDPGAERVWEKFYCDWEGQERPGLYGAATKRIHVFVRKLAMVYAAFEQTVPIITADQLMAAIGVGLYSAACARTLCDAQATTHHQGNADLEGRLIAFVGKYPGVTVRKMRAATWRYCRDSKAFNETIFHLERSDQIEIRYVGKKRTVYPPDFVDKKLAEGPRKGEDGKASPRG